MVVDDLTNDPRFARGVAEESGYVPTAMMVAPLLGEEDTLGVLSVLDRGRTGRTSLEELNLPAPSRSRPRWRSRSTRAPNGRRRCRPAISRA